MTTRDFIALGLCTTLCISVPAFANVTVSDAWIKVTAPGQTTAEAYMRIKSDTAAKLVGVSSPVAKIAQIHEMKMNGSATQMRAVPSLHLAAGETLQLKPEGYHIMLADISPPLKVGDAIPLVLSIEDADLKHESIKVELQARAAMSAKKRDPMNDMKNMKGMGNGY